MLNKLLSTLSGISGAYLASNAAILHDSTSVATGFQGMGAITLAVVLFQLADMRERMARIESVLIGAGVSPHKPKTHGKSV